MNKLIKLTKTLSSIGLKKEAEEAKSLQTIPDWLRKWRDTMKHYGFQNFGRDAKWWKSKSHLEEPLDKVSAEHDIHMVEQAHMPDAQGRRISDKALDTFMKEFYGESITIAPREGWRSKMSSFNTDYFFLKKIASELKDSILNTGKIILRDTGDILMAGLVYEGSVIGRIKAELVGAADGIDVSNEVTGGPLWLIHRDIEEEYRGLGLIKELLVSIHEYIEHNGGATIVYGVVSEQAKENTIKLNGFEKIPVTVIDFGNKKYILNRNKEDILDYFSLNGGLRTKSFVRMIDDEGYIDGAISDPFYSTDSSFYSKWKASIKSGYILKSSSAESKIKIENI